MNRSYLIVPGALLLGFAFYHRHDGVARQKRDFAHAAEVAAARRAEDDRKAALKFEAEERAKRHAAERAALERERVEKKRRDFESAVQKLAADTAAHAAEAEKMSREVAALEARVTELRAEKERADRAEFELAKQVELDRIRRRSVDLEFQRTARMVAARLSGVGWPDGGGTPGPRTP